ncbi:MAG: hypothetical protein ACM3NQ_11965 [Bacteroidales bacterium]
MADDLRRLQRDRVAAMTAGERVELAFQLGERDLDLYCATNKVGRDEARRRLARARHEGRNPSALMHSVKGT